MKNRANRFFALCWVLAATLLVTCDPFKEDIIPGDDQVVFNPNKQTVYYILPNSSTVIDLASIVQTAYTSLNLSVTTKPTRGDLTKLTDYTLRYEPHPDFTEGHDSFIYSIRSTSGRILGADTVYIMMGQNTEEFPCGLYAVEDFASIKPGSSVLINILDNDRICEIDKKDLFISIYSKPKHGTATLNSDVISYTANAGYKGWDQFVYKISAQVDDSLRTSFGLISILVDNEPCEFVTNNDSIHFKVYTPSPAGLEFSVLENGIICFADSLTLAVSIVRGPTQGTASSIENGKIRYEKSSAFSESYTDSLVYAVYFKGARKEGNVKLEFDYCPFAAKNDRLIVPVDTYPPIPFNINVLENDETCSINPSSLSKSIKVQPSRGTANFMDNGVIRYVPNPGGSDSFVYRLCYNGMCSEALVEISYIGVGIDSTSYNLNILFSAPQIDLGMTTSVFPVSGQNPIGAFCHRGGGGYHLVSEFRADAPDGKYKITYDFPYFKGGEPEIINFSVRMASGLGTIEGKSEALVFSGFDTNDLWNGPIAVQYFEKKGTDYFNFSPLIIETHPTDFLVNLTWDSGDGTPGDVDLDVYLYQIKACNTCGIGSCDIHWLKKSETPGTDFESLAANLGSDDDYGVVVDYSSGTSDNVTFTLTVSTVEGTINGDQKHFSKTLHYTVSNLGHPPCDGFNGCNAVITFTKMGTDLRFLR